MTRKTRAVEMTASNEEKQQLDELAELLGYGSRSDVLRHAVKKAFKLEWSVPLFKKPAEKIQPASVKRRGTRKKGK